MKKAGLDWRTAILGRCLSGAALAVARLKTDQNFVSEEERVRAFVASGAGCRASYFNHARKLKSRDIIPHIELLNNTPPADASVEASTASSAAQSNNGSTFGLLWKN